MCLPRIILEAVPSTTSLSTGRCAGNPSFMVASLLLTGGCLLKDGVNPSTTYHSQLFHNYHLTSDFSSFSPANSPGLSAKYRKVHGNRPKVGLENSINKGNSKHPLKWLTDKRQNIKVVNQQFRIFKLGPLVEGKTFSPIGKLTICLAIRKDNPPTDSSLLLFFYGADSALCRSTLDLSLSHWGESGAVRDSISKSLGCSPTASITRHLRCCGYYDIMATHEHGYGWNAIN